MSNNQTSPRADARRTIIRRKPQDKCISNTLYSNVLYMASLPLTFIYLEFVMRISMGGNFSASFFAYAVLFSAAFGIFAAILTTLFPEKVNYVLMLVLLSFICLYFATQVVYLDFFKDFFYWDLLGEAGNVTQFYREALGCITGNIGYILLIFLPVPLFAFFGKHGLRLVRINVYAAGAGLLAATMLYVGGVSFVNAHDGYFEDKYYYNEGFLMTEAGTRFGVLTALRLDTKYKLFGSAESIDPDLSDNTTVNVDQLFKPDTSSDSSGTSQGGSSVTPPEIDRSPNVLDVDFDKLIADASSTADKNAHTYFSNRTPTNKNEYTGLFEGKNLIFITVEGWSPAAINETLTPTLYKMKTEGFVFENYYCSQWGGSTATGEYANITGNFYNKQTCLRDSASNYMPFTLGNMLKAQGYATNAFHNWTYTYYSRNLSHANFGYTFHGTDYVKKGNYPTTGGWVTSSGANATFSRAWPLSDKELATNTLSYLTADEPFHIYYMTVSGHAFHTGNAQASKHYSYVDSLNLGYTEKAAKLYLAAQYEVELMVSELCRELEAKGILEDTVFVMAPDHYPYSIAGKSDGSIDEETTINALSDLYKLPKDNICLNFDLYRAPLIIWSASMTEPVTVSKVCSAPDILPTVLNLFGLEYDSRLIMGRDILSDSDGLVLLNCSNSGSVSLYNNWITDYGYYTGGQFYLNEGVEINDPSLLQSYIDQNNKEIKNMRTYSNYILEKDYYRKVFG